MWFRHELVGENVHVVLVYSLQGRCLQPVTQNCIDLFDNPAVLKELRSPQHSGDDSGHGSGHSDTN